jgi:hypothetical protein
LKQVLVSLLTIVLTLVTKPAAGFFVEGFSMISTGKYGTYSAYDSANQNYYTVEGKQYSDFALGLGSKWIHKKKDMFLKLMLEWSQFISKKQPRSSRTWWYNTRLSLLKHAKGFSN